jgi:hypothetical protein
LTEIVCIGIEGTPILITTKKIKRERRRREITDEAQGKERTGRKGKDVYLMTGEALDWEQIQIEIEV